MVTGEGLDSSTPGSSGQCSTSELPSHIGAAGGIRILYYSLEDCRVAINTSTAKFFPYLSMQYFK